MVHTFTPGAQVPVRVGLRPDQLLVPGEHVPELRLDVDLAPVFEHLLRRLAPGAAVVASAAIRATSDDWDKFLSYVDSIAITIIVLINASIAAVTENNANDALAALSSLQTPESIVIRDGKECTIKSREMVPGE